VRPGDSPWGVDNAPVFSFPNFVIVDLDIAIVGDNAARQPRHPGNGMMRYDRLDHRPKRDFLQSSHQNKAEAGGGLHCSRTS
jgi:hypothetical protein